MSKVLTIVSQSWRLLRVLSLSMEAAFALLEARILTARRNVLEQGDSQQSDKTDIESELPLAVAPLIAAVSRVSPWIARGEACLPRALALRKMLLRRGVDSELRLGTRHEDDGHFQAHAWLEVCGQVVIGRLPDLDAYRPLGRPTQSVPSI